MMGKGHYHQPCARTCGVVPVVPVLVILPSADGHDVGCHYIGGAGVDARGGEGGDACCHCLVVVGLDTGGKQAEGRVV